MKTQAMKTLLTTAGIVGSGHKGTSQEKQSKKARRLVDMLRRGHVMVAQEDGACLLAHACLRSPVMKIFSDGGEKR